MGSEQLAVRYRPLVVLEEIIPLSVALCELEGLIAELSNFNLVIRGFDDCNTYSRGRRTYSFGAAAAAAVNEVASMNLRRQTERAVPPESVMEPNEPQ